MPEASPAPQSPLPRTTQPTIADPTRAISAQATALYSAGDYLGAAGMYRKGYELALARGDRALALRFLNNSGGCWFALASYRKAMQAFLEARQLSATLGDAEMTSALSLNISSLYLQLGEVAGAAEAAGEGLAALAKLSTPKYRVQLLAQVALVKSWQGDLDGALPLFSEAIAGADREGNVPLQAKVCNLLGYELLKAGRVKQAEGPLLEGFRLRKLHHDREIDDSYLTVGILRMKQGDLRSAGALLNQAVAGATRPGRTPRWSPYYYRGQLHVSGGDLRAAVADFRTGLDLARRWRAEVIPAAAVRVSMEVELQQLYSAFIEAANRLYFRTHDAALVREGFEAAEENRSASLRALIADAGDWQRGLPEQYGQTLARLRAREISLLRTDSPALRNEIQRLRYELMQMEARAGLQFGNHFVDRPGGLLQRTQRALQADEALLSFHLGERESYVWEVTRKGIELRVVAGRAWLSGDARRFIDAVREGSAAVTDTGQRLYSALFGKAGKAAAAKSRWSLALDDVLFSAPLAALVLERTPARPVYLIERHTLEIVPSAHAIAGRLDAPSLRGGFAPGRFVALGDAVYNTADPRWRPRSAPASATPAALALARLAGSGREIRACAKAWEPAGPSVLLEGMRANRDELWKSLDGGAAVLHMAAHVTARKGGSSQALIALSLTPGGEPDFLSAADIAARRTRVGLVVLSGCSSGAGEALPGAGLMGLTRAWLAAGAGSVAASLWPTPDDSGNLFLSLYRHLKEGAAAGGPGPAKALATAQRDMLREGGWRALPRYWAGYFLFGKE